MLFNRLAVPGISDRVYFDFLAGKPGEHIVGKKHIAVRIRRGVPHRTIGSPGGG